VDRVRPFGKFRGQYVSQFDPAGGDDAGAVADKWVATLIGRPIDPKQRQVLVNALDGQPQREANVRRMVQLIVSMPEYQLC
jgi:hypothetical protein